MAVIVAAMVGVAACIPTLYRTFCSATGFGGTTAARRTRAGRRRGRDQRSLRRQHPSRPAVAVRARAERRSNQPGAQTKIFYRAQNLSARAWTGQAAYNVSPDKVGKYFKKIQCFCFTEQTLKAGQTVDMPVVFFVDPAIRQDPDTKDIDEITLSYTFYPVETGAAGR